MIRWLAALRRKQVGHTHTWVVVGYGGAGWYSLRCTGCPERSIG